MLTTKPPFMSHDAPQQAVLSSDQGSQDHSRSRCVLGAYSLIDDADMFQGTGTGIWARYVSKRD